MTPDAFPSTVTDHHVQLRSGPTVRVAEAGDVDVGTPVVLLHGNFASRRWWTELLTRPPRGLRLIAPDLPNFGASDPLPGPPSLDGYAAALIETMDALGVDRATLVGHSLGAAVVERVALAAPERTVGLILVDGAPPAGLPRPEEHYALLSGFVGDRDGLAAALAPLCGSRTPPYWETLLDDAVAMAAPAFEGNARALGTSELGVAPTGLSLPVVVLHGGMDPLIDADMAMATARHWPDAHLETWPDVGHSPQIEAPDRFAALVSAFVQGAAMT